MKREDERDDGFTDPISCGPDTPFGCVVQLVAIVALVFVLAKVSVWLN